MEVRRGLEGSERAGDQWGEEREVWREREEEVCEGVGSAVGAGFFNARGRPLGGTGRVV